MLYIGIVNNLTLYGVNSGTTAYSYDINDIRYLMLAPKNDWIF